MIKQILIRNMPSAVLLVAVCVGCNPLALIYEKMGWEDDNFAEESAEFIIENRTGIDVDLTPDSPEMEMSILRF